MQAHLDRHLRIDPVISPWSCEFTLLAPLKRRKYGLDRTSYRGCSSGSRARCFTVRTGAPATTRPIMPRPVGGTCSGLRRLAPAPVSRSTPLCSFLRRRVDARVYQHFVDIATAHSIHRQSGQMFPRDAALGKISKGDVSNAHVGGSVGDDAQDDGINA
jgi:hypothetical protein